MPDEKDFHEVILTGEIVTWIATDVEDELLNTFSKEEVEYIRRALPFLFISSEVCEKRRAFITNFPFQLAHKLPENSRMITATGRNQTGDMVIGVIKLEKIKLKKSNVIFTTEFGEKARSEIYWATGRILDGLLGVSGR